MRPCGLTVEGVHAGHETAQRRDPVALADPEHGGVDVRRAGLQRPKGVGDGAAGVVVAVKFDVAVGKTPQRAHHAVHLARGGDPDRVGDPQAIDHTQLVDRQIHPPQIGLRAAECVFGAKAQLDPGRLGPDPRQHLDRQLDDFVDALAVREMAQRRRSADHHVDSACACVQGDFGVFLAAADVGQYAGAEPHPGYRADVLGARG